MAIKNIQEAREYLSERMPSLDANKKAILRDIRNGSIDMKIGRLRETLGSDTFDAIGLDASHNSLIGGYNEVLDDWREVCRVMTTSDFKTVNASALSGFAAPPIVPQNTSYPESALLDEKVSYPIQKRGQTIKLSMEAMLNDSMGAFMQNIREQGKAFKTGLNEFVLGTQFDDAPTCDYDSVALFHATHANVQTSSTFALAKIESAIAVMMNQTGRKGEQIYIKPTKLLVPPSLAMQAAEAVSSAQKVSGLTTANGVPADNAVSRLGLKVIVSPHINAVAGQWYLGSDIPAVEVSFLNGRTEPEVFIEPDNTGSMFQSDAQTWKFRMVYGGDAIEHRGWVRSTV